MYDHEITQEDKRIIEGKITFTEKEKGFRRSSVVAAYQFLKRHHGNAWEYLKEKDVKTTLDREKFIEHHTKPELWNYHPETSASPDFILPTEIGSFAIKDYHPEEEPESQFIEPPNTGITWTFNEPGPHYINADWYKTDKGNQEFSFIIIDNHEKAVEKVEWLTKELCSHIRATKRKIHGTLSIDNIIEKHF